METNLLVENREAQGGSAKEGPANGWSHQDLANIMLLKATPITRNSSAGTNPSNGSGSNTYSPKNNVGAIAGGAIGGIVAVALGFLGVEVFRRLGQVILRLFSHLKSPPTSSETPGQGSTPAELIVHTQISRCRVCAVELPSGGVAGEMGTEP